MSVAKYIIIGALCGFIGFTISISMMKGVFFRPDDKGKKIFTLAGFGGFLKAPFHVGSPAFQTVWAITPGTPLSLKDRTYLWSMNWILWTLLGGGVVGGLISVTKMKKDY